MTDRGFDLEGKVIVITGASSGIGRATALRFAAKKEHLVLASRGEAALKALATECRAKGARVTVVPTDVSDHAQVKELARTAGGRIDVWINDAGIGAYAPFTELPVRELKRLVDVNLLGVAYGSRVALKRMLEQDAGVLINLSSVLGEVPQPTAAAYAMTKAAVRSLSEALRSELRGSGVSVCTVLPEGIDTPFYRHAANHTGREIKATPPVTSADRVARAIVRLADHPWAETFVGNEGAILAAWHRITPRPAEAVMSGIAATAQFGNDGVTSSSGILFSATERDDATVSGGFHGTARTVRRGLLAGAAVVAGIAAFGMLRTRRS